MDRGCGGCGGCRRRRAVASSLPGARTTSASCTKSFPSIPPLKASRPTGTLLVFWGGVSFRQARESSLLANHNDDEGIRLHLAATFARSGRSEIGGGEKNVVGFQVETHGAGAPLRGNIFNHREFVRRIFVDDRESAVTVGGERELRRGIEAVGVNAFADGGRPCHFFRRGLNDHHQFVLPACKEAAM